MTKPLSWGTWRNIMLGLAFAGATAYYLPHTNADYEQVKDTAESKQQQQGAVMLMPLSVVLAGGAEFARRKLQPS